MNFCLYIQVTNKKILIPIHAHKIHSYLIFQANVSFPKNSFIVAKGIYILK